MTPETFVIKECESILNRSLPGEQKVMQELIIAGQFN
jgi:hypothetical protein